MTAHECSTSLEWVAERLQFARSEAELVLHGLERRRTAVGEMVEKPAQDAIGFGQSYDLSPADGVDDGKGLAAEEEVFCPSAP